MLFVNLRTFSGFPHGSVLRPLLSKTFINDLCNVIKRSKCLLFADYVKIFCATNSVDDCNLLQCDIERTQVWCAATFMKLNSSNTGIIEFTIKTEVLYKRPRGTTGFKTVFPFTYKLNFLPIRKDSGLNTHYNRFLF